MADDTKGELILQRRGLASLDFPHLSSPSLPSSSSAWFGTRTNLLKKHAAHVEQSNRYLNARVAQANAMKALVDARIALSRSLTDFAALGEICAAHFLRGRRQRANELLVHELKCQTEESNARASLAAAHKNLSAISPAPSPASASLSGREAALTPAEVEEILRLMPEIRPETVRSLSHILAGRLKEKIS